MGCVRTYGVANTLFLCSLLMGAGVSLASERQLHRDLVVGDEFRNLRLYGHINRGLLSYDDGREQLSYFVDNNHSESRFGIVATAHINEDWSIVGNYEAQYDPYSSDYVNQLNRGTVDWSDAYLLRRLELNVKNRERGQIFLGQGHMASDGVSERDLSGTSLIGFSDVKRLAGGQFFQLSGTVTLSDVQVKDGFDNLDGLSRKLRVRYDTPRIRGFGMASSVGTEVVPKRDNITVWDIVADYKNDHGTYKLNGAVAFSQPDSNRNQINGSLSTLHIPSGLSLTAAAGQEDVGSRNQRFLYGKIGYQIQRFEFGLTALSADVYAGRDFNTRGSDSFSVGFQSVQKIDRLRTELFFGVRRYQYNDASADYKSGTGFLTGARLKF